MEANKILKEQRDTAEMENKVVENKQTNYENGIMTRIREAKELKENRTTSPLGIHLIAIRR